MSKKLDLARAEIAKQEARAAELATEVELVQSKQEMAVAAAVAESEGVTQELAVRKLDAGRAPEAVQHRLLYATEATKGS